ncbi:transporter substrate-binding domain-containing protein [uncultured Pseudodesulfovibrio sp.]|uniref:substrate-binding periplasmic protein n=1 Tax=uncultured Pseudodesulfovibrio sp. TaxID=2035858 RepID=UPI0029C6EF25|nr:transporter substrate-binding domain-containing protein [uncultured Pseudodesulfovibrio sp.]
MGQKILITLGLSLALVQWMLCDFSHAEELRFGYEDYPPLTYNENGVAKGISIDLLTEVSRRLNMTPVFVHLPFVRILHDVEVGAIDCAVDVYRSPDREVYMHYPSISVNPDHIYLYVNKASGLTIRSFADIGDVKVGAVRGYFYGRGVLERLSSNMVFVKSCCTLSKMLAEGRINVVLGNGRSIEFYLDEIGARSKVEPALLVSQVFSYMAFSKTLGKRGQELADLYADEISRVLIEKGEKTECE